MKPGMVESNTSASLMPRLLVAKSGTCESGRQEAALRTFAKTNNGNIATRMDTRFVEAPVKTDRHVFIHQNDRGLVSLLRQHRASNLVTALFIVVRRKNKIRIEADAVGAQCAFCNLPRKRSQD